MREAVNIEEPFIFNSELRLASALVIMQQVRISCPSLKDTSSKRDDFD